MGLLGLVGVVIAQEQSTTSAQSPLDIINSKDLTKEKTCKIVYHQSEFPHPVLATLYGFRLE